MKYQQYLYTTLTEKEKEWLQLIYKYGRIYPPVNDSGEDIVPVIDTLASLRLLVRVRPGSRVLSTLGLQVIEILNLEEKNKNTKCSESAYDIAMKLSRIEKSCLKYADDSNVLSQFVVDYDDKPQNVEVIVAELQEKGLWQCELINGHTRTYYGILTPIGKEVYDIIRQQDKCIDDLWAIAEQIKNFPNIISIINGNTEFLNKCVNGYNEDLYTIGETLYETDSLINLGVIVKNANGYYETTPLGKSLSIFIDTDNEGNDALKLRYQD